MKNNNENDLLALGDFMKQGVGYAVSNGGKIIAAITLVVATLATFANVTFANLGGEAFTITLAVMMVSSYVMYFSLEDVGEKEGAECKEYSEAKGKFLAVKGTILPEDIEPLREFCIDYSESELNFRKRNYLCENGLTLSDLESFEKGKKYPLRSRKALKKAGRMKAVKLTVTKLLSISRTTTQSELEPPEKSKFFSTVISLAPSTICTFFTVSIILTTKNELTVSSVIDGLIKLSALPIVGLKGFLDVYRYSKEALSAWFETKTRVLEAFLLKQSKEIRLTDISK